jgi:hypothetical protein
MGNSSKISPKSKFIVNHVFQVQVATTATAAATTTTTTVAAVAATESWAPLLLFFLVAYHVKKILIN